MRDNVKKAFDQMEVEDMAKGKSETAKKVAKEKGIPVHDPGMSKGQLEELSKVAAWSCAKTLRQFCRKNGGKIPTPDQLFKLLMESYGWGFLKGVERSGAIELGGEVIVVSHYDYPCDDPACPLQCVQKYRTPKAKGKPKRKK